jgi:fatty acid kinase fatty acid binding subunit
MPNVVVVTDSCASIPEALIEALNIHWVAYYIHCGEEVLRDLVTIQRDAFLQRLVTARTLPTTASPGPGDYLAMYERLVKEGAQNILSLHMTSKASGAYQAACVAQSMARESLPEARIEVVDTRNVSLCQGWMAIEAARAAMAGKSLDDILSLVRRMIPLTRMIQTADTLKYLYMGGRIGQAQHLMGTLLNIKPLIGMEDGVIVALGKARSRMGAYKAMIEIVERAVGYRGKIKIAYVHAGALQEVEKIREMIEARLTCVETLVAELSPALAVHTGPGTAGLCYYPVEGA